ncbi:TonB-dependent receptor [Novosphingobium sp. ERN07]|uniref:TonB-dependent receptor n=1 Tax=Novosphingobium sp. ERN07 TaxID=2726187 RepID=UPI0014567826|nr:TonB-dependent receptor [Novosphingobium sp. ERN07]NLR72512.1 TonB-dependent receptor [Novosphingobium sp. ERN07]
MKTLYSRGTALGAVIAAMVMPNIALAQQAEDQPASTGLAEIIVTAQRRTENLQDVPIAITAANSETLAQARVENVANIQAISPSISFRVTNIATSSANLIIRGLGTTGNSRSFEGSVGVFIDGVYRTRAAAALQNFLDIENLQVLRGPQGTLFGKNTTAGALLLSSAAPSLNEASGVAEVTYANYDTLIARGAVTTPLSDKVAVRLAGLFSHQDGFFTDSTTGKDLNGTKTRAVKGQLLFEPDENLTIRLIGDYSFSDGNCCYATSAFVDGPTQPIIDLLTRFQPSSSQQFLGVLAGLIPATAMTPTGRVLPARDPSKFQQTLNGDGNQEIEDYGGTLLIDAQIGEGTLKSITSVRKFTVDQRDLDPDFSGADIFRYNESFSSRFISQELVYNTKIPALNAEAVIGAFFSDEKLRMGRSLPWASQAQFYWDAIFASLGVAPGTAFAGPGTWTTERMGGTAKSYAGFAHLDFAVNDKFNVITGLRYSVEKKRGFFNNAFYRPIPTDVFTLLGIAPSPAYDETSTNKALSGTLGLQYRPTNDVMLYATYNRGFKAGGVNMDVNAAGTLINNAAVYNALPAAIRAGFFGNAPAQAPLDPRYKPEKVNAFEVGGKFQYMDGRARTNIAFFYYDLSDLQIAQFIGLRFTVLNAQSAKDYGVEIENMFQLTDGLTLGLDGTWIPHAKYGVDARIDPVLSGSRFRFTPKFSGNATLNLDQPLGDNLNLLARVQAQYTSRQLISTATLDEQGPVTLVNANLGFKLPQTGVLIEGWVQNLFDKTWFTQTFPTPLQTGDRNAYPGSPRTYGIRVRANF